MSEIWRWPDHVDQMPDLFIANHEFPTCDLRRDLLPQPLCNSGRLAYRSHRETSTLFMRLRQLSAFLNL